jgi:hypothetical protein
MSVMGALPFSFEMIRGLSSNERIRQMFPEHGCPAPGPTAPTNKIRARAFFLCGASRSGPFAGLLRRPAQEAGMNYGLSGLLGLSTGIDTIRNVARAVQGAAETLEPEIPQLAGFVRDAAQTVERLSTDLRQRSLGEIATSVSDFARREPIAFFGSAILAGFLLARMAQSAGDERTLARARLP